jgi:hypothetical protein
MVHISLLMSRDTVAVSAVVVVGSMQKCGPRVFFFFTSFCFRALQPKRVFTQFNTHSLYRLPAVGHRGPSPSRLVGCPAGLRAYWSDYRPFQSIALNGARFIARIEKGHLRTQ